MRRIRPIAVALQGVVMLIAAIGWGSALAGSPGEAGLLSLRLGVGAREAGMGDAGLATSTGAAAIYWNPANNVLGGDFETELALQHQRYLGLFNQEAAVVAHRVGRGVLGFMFTGFYSDDIDRYVGPDEGPTGIWQGKFRPYDVVLGVSYAMPLGKSFAIGVTGKMIYEKIDIYSDTGFALDIGITHKAVIRGLVFAANVTNLGKDMQLKDDPIPLPRAYRLGAAWSPPDFASGKFTVAGDVIMPRDGQEKAHLGSEYRMVPELSLRLGTHVNYESQGLTAGAGFRTGVLALDYAYSQWTEDGFDDGHRFTLRLIW